MDSFYSSDRVEEVVGRCGGFSCGFEAHIAFGGRDEVEAGLADEGHVVRTVIGPEPAEVVMEDDIHDPIQPVFDMPVGAHGLDEERGIGGRRG